MFDFPSIAAISQHIVSLLPPEEDGLLVLAQSPSRKTQGVQPRRLRRRQLQAPLGDIPPANSPLTSRTVLGKVQRAVHKVLGQANPPPDEAPLMSSGLASLAAVELRNSLEAEFGLDLPTTLVSEEL